MAPNDSSRSRVKLQIIVAQLLTDIDNVSGRNNRIGCQPIFTYACILLETVNPNQNTQAVCVQSQINKLLPGDELYCRVHLHKDDGSALIVSLVFIYDVASFQVTVCE